MRVLTCLLLALAFLATTCLSPRSSGPEPTETLPSEQETLDSTVAEAPTPEAPATVEPATAAPATAETTTTKPTPEAPATVEPTPAAALVSLAAETKAQPTPVPTLSPSSGQVRILMYHYIRGDVPASDQIGRNLSTSPSDFDEQVRFLANRGYVGVSADDIIAFRQRGKPLPAKAVMLTFDDGYADFFTAARPILRRYKFQATVNMLTGMVGVPGYLSWSQLSRLVEDGFTIGSHTINHVDLRVVNDKTLERELRESKRQLEDRLGIAVRDFCYPSGMFDQRVRAAVAAAGYQTAVTVKYGIAGPTDDLLALPRIRITGGISLRQFAALLGESPPSPPSASQPAGR